LDSPLRGQFFNLWPFTRQTRSAEFSPHSGSAQASAWHHDIRTGRGFAPNIRRMPRQLPLVQEAKRRLARSQMDTKRFGNLSQCFPSGRVTVTPIGAARQLVKNVRACFWCGLGRKLVPEVFYQLQTLESSQDVQWVAVRVSCSKFRATRRSTPSWQTSCSWPPGGPA
jgi:hypothetical protein